MAVTDWRAWVAQQGGMQPGQTPPFPFPGVGPITDLISGAGSVPVYQDVPTTIKPADPYSGWNAQVPNSMPPVQPPGVVQISDVVPGVGAPAGGTAVQVQGSGFTGATAVNFGATVGTAFSVVSDIQINVTTPAGTTKTTVTVTVVSPKGNSILYNGFSYS